MSQKISKTKQVRFLIVLFFLILGLGMVFPNSAQALTWLPSRIANSLISAVLGIFIQLSGIVLGIASALLNWVTSPSFVGVKFTDNAFVTPAWTLVRDFANMGFVLALVAIGLGTALGRAEYKIQKTLPMLVVMALAINFTPVICGFFIDISNMIMGFFLQGISWDWAVRTWRSMTISLANSVPEQGPLEVLAMAIGMIAFNLVAGMVFITFALIFAARYVALWILVILSPLAFFSFILPATKSVWKEWWKQFTQWCFVGVMAGFWIYLSYQIMVVSGEIGGQPALDPEFSGLSGVVGYIIPIIFLTFGLTASIAGAPQGAELAVKASQWVRGRGEGLVKTTRDVVRSAPQVQSGEERIRRRLETMPVAGRLVGGPGAFEQQRATDISSARGNLENIPDTDEGNEAIRKRITQRPLTRQDRLNRIAGLEALAKRGALKDEDRKYLREMGQRGGDTGAVFKQRPDFADELLPAGATPAQKQAAVQAEIQKIRANKAREINADALKNENVVKALDEKQAEDIGKNGSVEQRKNITTALADLYGASLTPPQPGSAYSGLQFVPGHAPAGVNPQVWDHIATQQAAGKCENIP